MPAPPYKAKSMRPCNPMEYGHSGEFTKIAETGTTKSPHRPSKVGTSGALIDGPYGGKKPQS